MRSGAITWNCLASLGIRSRNMRDEEGKPCMRTIAGALGSPASRTKTFKPSTLRERWVVMGLPFVKSEPLWRALPSLTRRRAKFLPGKNEADSRQGRTDLAPTALAASSPAGSSSRPGQNLELRFRCGVNRLFGSCFVQRAPTAEIHLASGVPFARSQSGPGMPHSVASLCSLPSGYCLVHTTPHCPDTHRHRPHCTLGQKTLGR